MKEYYKISEISKLYGIGIDSLRYYEKLGLLKPRRDINGYRLYNLKEIYKLNIIRDLRELDFSMKHIKEYLDNQCIDNTINLLCEQQDFIHDQLKKLQVRKRIIQNRIAFLKNTLGIQPGVLTVKTLPARPCVQLNEHITREEEMDFVIKKIHRKHESKILDLGNQSVGAYVSMDDLNKGMSSIYYSVFFILDKETKDYDFILPAGQYISYYYRGGYDQNLERMEEVIAYAKNIGCCILGDPFEIYVVDNRDTIKAEEFLTEIQIRIEKEKN
ncbi:MAG: MerR family transcriptional regulator [Tissierellia bacterium]|nr:MerR family transcriptional regulator [Tissierellia bacterium]MDD4781210.1 MerR family transcriptional regulator [Tissierellia bacterium]